MVLEVTCPGCGARTLVPESARGTWGCCPRCLQPVQVPVAGAAPAAGAKVCVVCQKDLHGQSRIKDPKGRYYCELCYAAHAGGKNSQGAGGGSPASPTAVPETSPFAPQGDLAKLAELLPADLQPLAPIETSSPADAGVTAVAHAAPQPAARSGEQFCSRCGRSDASTPLVIRDGKYICAECEGFLFRGERRQAMAEARRAERASQRNLAGFSRTARRDDREPASGWLATILTMVGCLAALAALQLIMLGIASAINPKIHIWAHPDVVGGYVSVLTVGRFAAALLLIAFLVLFKSLSPDADYGNFKTMVIKATALIIVMFVVIFLLGIALVALVGVAITTGQSGTQVAHGDVGVIIMLLIVAVPLMAYFWLVRKLFGASFLTTFLALMLQIVAGLVLIVVLVVLVGIPLAVIGGALSHGRQSRQNDNVASSVTPSANPSVPPASPAVFPSVTPPVASGHIRRQPTPAPVVPEPVRVPAPGYWSTAQLSRPCGNVAAATAGHDALFCIGGVIGIGDLCHVDIYNARTDRWSSDVLPQPDSMDIAMSGASVGDDAVFYNGNFLYLFDSKTGRWWATRSMAGISSVVAVAGHDVLCVSSTGSQGRATVHIFNTRTRTWSSTELSETRTAFATATVGPYALFAGGSNMIAGLRFPRAVASNTVDIFDSTTGQWSTSRLAQSRAAIAATSVGHDALFAGGINVTPSNMVDIFNPSSARQSTARLVEARSGIIAVSAGHKALFAGGGWPMPTDLVDIFDARTGTWSMSRLSVPRAMSVFFPAVAATVGDCAIFADGTQPPNDVVDIFNARTGQWSVSHLSQARGNLAVAIVGHQALFAGGSVQQKDGLPQPSNVVDIFHFGHQSSQPPSWLPGPPKASRATRVVRIGPCQVWVKGNEAVTSYYMTANGQRSVLRALTIMVAVKNTSQQPVTFKTWRDTPVKFRRNAPGDSVDQGIATLCTGTLNFFVCRFFHTFEEPRGLLWETRTIQPGQTIYDAVFFNANPGFTAPFRLVLPTQNIGHGPSGFVWLKVPAVRVRRWNQNRQARAR